jgi:hypothetical protein
MKSNSFSISITEDMLKNMVKSMINHPHGDIITNVIVNHLDNFAVEQLYRAMSGIEPKVNIHVGLTALIDVKRACGWKYSTDDQIDNLIQGKYISCHVTNVDPYKPYPISICYDMYKNGELEQTTSTCAEDDLIIEKYD